jgi:hypothetical protein
MDAPPIVCTLTDEELRLRREGLLRQVRERVVAVRRWAPEEEDGAGAAAAAAAPLGAIELRLERDEETLAALLELVRLESRCCAFLRYRLTVEPAGGALLLEVSGPLGGMDLMVAELAPPTPQGAVLESGER